MSTLLQHLLRILIHLGYIGPFVLGILDSSFLFLPFGNDLLVVALTARNHRGYWIYVVSAACGSTLGVLALDWVARGIGEGGITRMAGKRRFEYLKRMISKHGGKALVLGCLAPPPFPFTMAVAVNSALGYPRSRLLLLVGLSRGMRFAVLGALAVYFGHQIIHLIDSAAFKNFMYVFTSLCLLGSITSVVNWVRKSRSRSPVSPNTAPAEA